MATANPFDLLGDDDNDDVAALVKMPPVAKEKPAAKKSSNAHVQTAASGKLPAKPLSPSQPEKGYYLLPTSRMHSITRAN